MKGHLPLIAMRKRGQVPARGVVIDAGRTYHADADTWADTRWPRAFVEIGDREPVKRLDLCFTAAMRVVLVRQPEYPMPAFAELTRAVLAHHPDLLTCVVCADDGRSYEVQHHRSGQWLTGWPAEELQAATDGWPNREH